MSEIQWTDETWNPTVGCSRVSAGCDNCYAIRVAAREMQPAHKGLTKDGDWTGEVRLMPDRLDKPLYWKKPRRVFVDSMSDLFHESIPNEFVEAVFDIMASCREHTFQILTKRPQRMTALLNRWNEDTWVRPDGLLDLSGRPVCPGDPWPLPNVWLGTSIETDRYARIRTPHLLCTPAAVRFLSAEPMLGDVDLTPYLGEGIGWVIVGGESGPGARPMQLEWAQHVVDDCIEANVPVFVKQLGSVWAKENGATDKKGGDITEWPESLQIRQWPA